MMQLRHLRRPESNLQLVAHEAITLRLTIYQESPTDGLNKQNRSQKFGKITAMNSCVSVFLVTKLEVN